jgi:transposase
LIVTREGYPLGYEVFDGNTADVTTVQEIISKVEERHGKAQRIWVMDRGNTSEANLAFIRERNGHYIVGTPKAQMGRFASELTEEGWRQVREGIEVKLAKNPVAGSSDSYLLCRSRERSAKEQSMAKRFEERMEAGLGKLAQAAAQGRLRDAAVAHQRLGRLLEKHWRAAGLFAVAIEAQADGRLQVRWSKCADREAWLKQSSGCYVLRTNLENPDPVELWKSYIQLTDAEWAFRITKDELAIRPVWHQGAARVQAHILVCFLAYALWKTLGGWMKLAGLGDSPRVLVDELHTIRSVDVVLQTLEDESPGPPLTVRCVTRPDDHQAVLLERLGLELPDQIKRFRMPLESTLAKEVPPTIVPM